MPEKAPAPEKAPEASAPAPATIFVALPADARLLIDGNATRSTTANRMFITPALERGKEFTYTLKAEIVRDGQTYSAIQRVTVRGGAESKVTLEVPVSVAAE
jgi:uncharacterized protein (TIGR03000 family)